MKVIYAYYNIEKNSVTEYTVFWRLGLLLNA